MPTTLPPELAEKIREIARDNWVMAGSHVEESSDHVFDAILEAYPLIREHVMREDMEICRKEWRTYSRAGNESAACRGALDYAITAIERAMLEGK